jgi:hypothetical protein
LFFLEAGLDVEEGSADGLVGQRLVFYRGDDGARLLVPVVLD